ncbi:MAG TPA: glycoside hydrolase family 2 TIM barrel-domain containing protein [Bacteroidales bacterium]|nr:glycoside hydrolase family 2 TIM barrel-domain containing protein [Bacteroidales bacterium]
MKILDFKLLITTFLFINLFFQKVDCQIYETIPLPEHPRPDFQREKWKNLNGIWNFRFDPENSGINDQWYNQPDKFDRKIVVPFPWGSKLSGVSNEAEIGWYNREIEIPEDWDGKKVFIVFGASDWITTAWLNGQKIGTFQGGYTPFEFDITPFIKNGQKHQLVVRVDDSPFSYKLEGKQGYGQAKGIWQTVYLDARGDNFIKSVHFTPDIDKQKVTVKVITSQPATTKTTLKLTFMNGSQAKPEIIQKIKKGENELNFQLPVENMVLWDLNNPFLYDVLVTILENNAEIDHVQSYFGMRKISTVNLPGLNYNYIALNNKPVYLQMCLDQSYNPDGFYTFPSDEFMKEEIVRSKRIGLNTNRIHIKVEIPRKLYWADKLGLLIMADVPNFWGEPDKEAQHEHLVAMEGMIERDYNHPSIFQWVLFNETWGLFTEKKEPKKERLYLPETQEWVESLYRQAKVMDPTRLVEDNSACNYDHVVSDVNSWHVYIPGYEWKKHLDEVCSNTFPGSKWNFIGGRIQEEQPLFNSECGNVWGYSGSTGDVDWSWDYHLMMNEFRSHPKICGWLYTEHHDVINEWNGYYKYDRSEKYTGLEDIVPGMTLKDLHSDVYISVDGPLCREVKPFESVQLPLFASFMTDADLGTNLTVKTDLYGWDNTGNYWFLPGSSLSIQYKKWDAGVAGRINLMIPDKQGIAILTVVTVDASGRVLHRNFTTFFIGDKSFNRLDSINNEGQEMTVVRFAPSSFKSQSWSQKQWNVLNGLKVDGAGYGYFEYEIELPETISADNTETVSLIAELSAKQLFGKDRKDARLPEGDYMLGKGTNDPSQNPNSYPMTDTRKYSSMVRIVVNGESLGTFFLEDDPADHRGILSWYSQPHDRKLYEAGSYGYLVKASIPAEVIRKASDRQLKIRFEVDESFPGGLAIYGERFGRYPVDPSVIFVKKK